MPTFVDLQKRLKHRSRPYARLGTDETLIADERAQMRSGDFIEAKLRAAQEADLRQLASDLDGESGPEQRD